MKFLIYLIISTIVFIILNRYQQQQYIQNINNDGEALFNLVLLSQDQGAKCLDNSPPSLFIRYGKGENKNKYIISFEGGGWCGKPTIDETFADCLSRSYTKTGTSTVQPQTKTYGGIFDYDPEKNPHFHDYTQIMINYCDGTGHQGYLEEPISYNGKQLWFRGDRNTKEAFRYAMEKMGMKNADQVIISGGSAGGLACFTWVDYYAKILKEKKENMQVFGACDAGVFLDFENMETQEHTFRKGFQDFMLISNTQQSVVNKKCRQRYPSEIWKCMFSQYLLEFIETPTLITEALYDRWSIPNVIGADCVSNRTLNNCDGEQKQQIMDYKAKMMEVLHNMIEKNPNLGVWAISCINHGFQTSSMFNNIKWEVPAGSGWTAEKATWEFVNGNMVRQIDNVSWPKNLPCASFFKNFLSNNEQDIDDDLF